MEWKPFPNLRLILNNSTCLPFGALWAILWGSLGFRFWNGFRLPIPWDRTVINNMFGEVKLALKHMAKAPNPTSRFGPHNLHFIIVAETCSLVDGMYVTAMPGVAT